MSLAEDSERKQGDDIVVTEEIWQDAHVQELLKNRTFEYETAECKAQKVMITLCAFCAFCG